MTSQQYQNRRSKVGYEGVNITNELVSEAGYFKRVATEGVEDTGESQADHCSQKECRENQLVLPINTFRGKYHEESPNCDKKYTAWKGKLINCKTAYQAGESKCYPFRYGSEKQILHNSSRNWVLDDGHELKNHCPSSTPVIVRTELTANPGAIPAAQIPPHYVPSIVQAEVVRYDVINIHSENMSPEPNYPSARIQEPHQ